MPTTLASLAIQRAQHGQAHPPASHAVAPLLDSLQSIASTNGIPIDTHQASSIKFMRLPSRDDSNATIKGVDAAATPIANRILPFSTGTLPSSPPKHSLLAPLPATTDTGSISHSRHSSQQDEVTWASVAQALKPIADQLRTPTLRGTLGETPLASVIVSLLILTIARHTQQPNVCEAQVQLLRVIANLCIDHDTNREVLLTHGAPSAIVSLITAYLPPNPSTTRLPLRVISLLRTATGALLNLQLDHAPTRNALRTPVALRAIVDLASCSAVYTPAEWCSWSAHSVSFTPTHASVELLVAAATTVRWAWRVLADVCSSEGSGEASSDSSRAFSPVDERELALSDEQGSATMERSAAQAKACMSNVGAAHALAFALVPFVPGAQSATSPSSVPVLPLSPEEVSTLIDADAEILQATSELLESCAQEVAAFRTAALVPSDASDVRITPLARLCAFLEHAEPPSAWSPTRDAAPSSSGASPPPPPSPLPAPDEPEAALEAVQAFGQIKASVARAIVAIAGDDANMRSLFGQDGGEGQGVPGKACFIVLMKDWMARGSQRDDLVSTSLLAVGNLARTDSHCLLLVHEHALASRILPLLSSSDFKVQHGAAGLLKNLAIPPANKAPLGAAGVIRTLRPCLSPRCDKIQPLQFAAIGAIKHLCNASRENALRVVLPPAGDADQEVEGDEGPTGVLPALLALLTRTDDVPTRMEGTRIVVNVVRALWNGRAAENEDAASVETARKALTSAPIANALADMVRTSPKYPVLVNEGIFALTLLASSNQGALLVGSALHRTPVAPSFQDADAAATASDIQGADISHAASSGESRPSAADMVLTVLGRRDARMPPEFAANACALVKALAVGVRGGSGKRKEGDDAHRDVRELLNSFRTPLLDLASPDVGPSETLEPAAAALKALDEFEGAR